MVRRETAEVKNGEGSFKNEVIDKPGVWELRLEVAGTKVKESIDIKGLTSPGSRGYR